MLIFARSIIFWGCLVYLSCIWWWGSKCFSLAKFTCLHKPFHLITWQFYCGLDLSLNTLEYHFSPRPRGVCWASFAHGLGVPYSHLSPRPNSFSSQPHVLLRLSACLLLLSA
jgi:hypothetical protein